MFNNAYPDDPITYYVVQSIVQKNRHILLSGEYPSDDCRCQDCENVELFLLALRRELRVNNRSDLAANVSEDPITFLEKYGCSIKLEDCVNAKCADCPEGDKTRITEFLQGLNEFRYAQWVHEEKLYKKVQVTEDGKGAYYFTNIVLGIRFRRHLYGCYRQHSELKYLKGILDHGEAICSVDFAKNYENKQRNEIQNAFFGHESFSIFTSALYYRSDEGINIEEGSGLNVCSIAFVCNETKHERNLAFTCSNSLIEKARVLIPNLKKVFFWSDGCTKEFRSRFTFRSLSYYPEDVQICWDYGESHHFKGPHDGIGGCLKSKIYNDVKKQKVIINNAFEFAEYGDKNTDICVYYIDKADIIIPNVDDAIYVKGTLGVHHVERSSNNVISFYEFSNYKTKSTKLLQELSYSEAGCSDDEVIEEARPALSNNEEERNDKNEGMETGSVVESGMWVLVNFEGEMYPGVIVSSGMDGAVVKVMHRCKGGWCWPNRPDEIEYSYEEIIMRDITSPKEVNKRGTFAFVDLYI